MKTINIICALLCLAVVACENSSPRLPIDNQIYQETYDRVQQLIEEGGSYDVTNVATLLNDGNDCGWQLDAMVVYDSDFKNVTDIYDDFDENYEYDSNTPIYVFGVDSKMWSYDIDKVNGTIFSEVGTWNFNPRTFKLTISIPKYADNSAIDLECTLCSICSDAIVLEWLSEDSGAIRVVLHAVKFQEMKLLSVNIAIANLIEECYDFDAEEMINGIQGEWTLDSTLIYNEDWTKIIEPLKVMGTDCVEGLGYVTYVFNNEYMEMHSFNSAEPDTEPEITKYTWIYNTATRKLILVGDNSNLEYIVSGFSRNYLILDYVMNNGRNLRTILKCK